VTPGIIAETIVKSIAVVVATFRATKALVDCL
jgi:hypothetical protein